MATAKLKINSSLKTEKTLTEQRREVSDLVWGWFVGHTSNIYIRGKIELRHRLSATSIIFEILAIINQNSAWGISTYNIDGHKQHI